MRLQDDLKPLGTKLSESVIKAIMEDYQEMLDNEQEALLNSPPESMKCNYEGEYASKSFYIKPIPKKCTSLETMTES